MARFRTRAESVERSLTFIESPAAEQPLITRLILLVHGRTLAAELRKVRAELAAAQHEIERLQR
jgi:hypothetical protein